MTLVDLVLKNSKLVTPAGIFEGGVAVESGKIVAIGKDATLPNADKDVDLHGALLMPGAIDAHCHCHAMGRSDWEDFTTGTMAAAAGGITTILEMPQTVPPTATVEAFIEKRKTAERDAVVDFALYGGAGEHNIGEIPGIAKEGAIAFKTFMTPPSPGREKDFWGLYVTDDGVFLEILKTIAQTGLISTIHAENSQIANYLAKKLQSEGKKDLAAYLQSRPGVTESEGISRALRLASASGTRTHICHVCAKEAVEVIARAKQNGQPVTAETCPHYLTFTADEINHMGPYAKINPPIRKAEDRATLWNALNSGVIDIVASDHGPFTEDLKNVGLNDIWKASMGAPTLDVMLPVMLTHVNGGLISIGELIAAMSEKVAKIFGLYPRKGSLSVGADADMVVVDLKKKKRLRTDQFYTKAKAIAHLYEGMEVEGLPIATFVNGIEVMRDGEVFGKPGSGHFISRPKNTANPS
jgi:dihydropyrimidinase/allantoinase